MRGFFVCYEKLRLLITILISIRNFVDIQWWYKFLRAYHDVSMITSNNCSSSGEVFITDACLTGCGGICARYYFHAEFSEFISIQRLDINYLKLLTIVVALKLWGHLWRGFRLIVRRDNELGPITHSLRAGGASAVANAGVPYRQFKRRGLWKSVSAKGGNVDDSLISRLSMSKRIGI